MFPFRRILHPTDFSVGSRPAFDLACAIARDSGAEVIVAHVLIPAPLIAPEGVLITGMPEDHEQAMTRLAEYRSADRQVPIRHELVHGDAVTGILDVAASTNADLIVLGTHGWTGLTRLLMGSVAEGVMRKAPCPVLTVKAPASAEIPATDAKPASVMG